MARRYVVLERVFEVPFRYELMRPIGQGSYGTVVSARDTLTDQLVAIKKHSDILKDVTDAKRTLREIRLLRFLNHENVVKLIDVYVPPSAGYDFNEVYTVSELMDGDLHQIISATQHLSPDHLQYFVYQILRALKYIHSANVLHRDLKPSNILLNRNCDLKICDFGLAREVPDNPDDLTAYVATRWYRAPENLLIWKNYTNAIDVWSVGCIIAEVLNRKPLFPGTEYAQQLGLVFQVIGSPSMSAVSLITTENVRTHVLQNLMHLKPQPIEGVFPNAPPLLRDLLRQMLRFDPEERITVDEALKHPYLQRLHEMEDEPTSDTVFQFEFDSEDDNKSTEPTKEQLKRLIWQEAVMFRYCEQEQLELRNQQLQQQEVSAAVNAMHLG